MDAQQKYQLASQRAEEKIGFYIHFGVFVLVNALLIAINLATDATVLWFIWPLIGWGVGVIGHAYLVFSPQRSSSFKERLIARELDKLQ